MTILLLAIAVAVALTAGFVLGLRYAKHRLPVILAAMPIKELARVGNQASKLRNFSEDEEPAAEE